MRGAADDGLRHARRRSTSSDRFEADALVTGIRENSGQVRRPARQRFRILDRVGGPDAGRIGHRRSCARAQDIPDARILVPGAAPPHPPSSRSGCGWARQPRWPRASRPANCRPKATAAGRHPAGAAAAHLLLRPGQPDRRPEQWPGRSAAGRACARRGWAACSSSARSATPRNACTARQRGGTLLLQPDQDPINVIGLAWGRAALRRADLHRVPPADRPAVHQPAGQPDGAQHLRGLYVERRAGGDVRLHRRLHLGSRTAPPEKFVSMSQDAGGTGSGRGLVFAGADWDFMTGGRLRADVQYGIDVYNTVYVDARVPVDAGRAHPAGAGRTVLPAALSVGDAQIGDFSTWGAGCRPCSRTARSAPAVVHPHRHGLQYAEPVRRTPVVPEPAAGGVQQRGRTCLGRRGEREPDRVRRDRTLRGMPYAAGRDRVDSSTGAPVPNRNELDLRARLPCGQKPTLAGLA